MSRISTSLRHAIEGIGAGFKSCENMKIHGGISILVLIGGLFFAIHAWEWAAIVICIALVIALELINSAIEEIVNIVKPEIHPKAKFIKDVSAGAVLVASFGALAVSIIIFLPKVLILLGF